MTKIALITGATSGIGEATAIEFAKHNYNLIITGRRSGRLIELAKNITEEYDVKVKTLVFDVRIKTSVDEAMDSLEARWNKIDVLVNNAGLASGLDPIQNGDVADWEKMIDTNVKGLLYVSKSVIPLMIANKKDIS